MRRRDRHPLLLALGASFVLHLLAVIALPVPIDRAQPVDDQRPLEVALVRRGASPVEPPSQMVAPPENINDEPPDETRLESDRDNTVFEETVRSGVPHPAPPIARAQPRPEPETAPERATAADDGAGTRVASARRAHVPALADLFASTDELVRAQQSDGAEHQEPQAPEAPASGERRIAVAVPLAAPDYALSGTYGTLDYLPHIRRGAVTLLNTKANVFSPFVRRVGERVFQHLVIRQRRLDMLRILSARNPVRMRVLLDPRGRLKSVRVQAQSGSVAMDETLSAALETAAFDNNPPPDAANADGDYEFVFQARIRTYNAAPGGQPSRIESRLSIGLL